MLSAALTRGSDPRRLRLLLVLLLLALAIPTGLVIWQAYGRLQWEAFHQYRTRAEELTRRIDRDIGARISAAEARGFADYAFINVSGGAGGILQRSPLAAYPVEPLLPGLIGYFQVNADGNLSTPLLPAEGTDPSAVGIGQEEYRQRLELAREIGRILADNRLVGERGVASVPARDADVTEKNADKAADEVAGQRAAAPNELAASTTEGKEATAEFETGQRQRADAFFSQSMFDLLSQAPQIREEGSVGNEVEHAPSDAAERRKNVYGKVQDLRLDDALNRKSETLEENAGAAYRQPSAAASPEEADGRSRRMEQASLPESIPASRDLAARGPDTADNLRITTFESEVDPFEFSLLDSGHFVLFRKVWRNAERYTQGALVEQGAFVNGLIEAVFRTTALADMSDLVVAYRDDVIGVAPARGQKRYGVEPSEMPGALLYRSRLSAPIDALELIFSVRRLPPGPGAAVLGWTTVLLAAVLVGGFFILYRLGMGQIGLARQQQDFVSSVSHELKTPLTSIRMYGEMLKEGWTDEDRRQHYYEYIHDESERLTRLIENVLRLASITRNGLDLDLQPTTAGRLMDQVQSKIASQVERAGFELEITVSDDTRAAELRVDEDCFVQIFINLVDNAMKFSRKAAARKVDIAAGRGGGSRLRFSVRDYGPGVPRDQMKKIFRLFYRTERELTRETVGTGIGLAIVHELAVAMSGEVDVVNREPGAEFGVSFPVRGQPA